MERIAEITRKTTETEIHIKLGLDGSGSCTADTGIGFLDHMLTLFARHGLIDLSVKAAGDLNVDAHHTVEDIGIVLGHAIKQALGVKESVKRYGTSFLPMDEALAMVSVDLSGRPFIVCDLPLEPGKLGTMETEMVGEFFRAVAFNAAMTLHIKVLYGSNNHHITEAVFKAFGRALGEAGSIDPNIKGVMSTKGMID